LGKDRNDLLELIIDLVRQYNTNAFDMAKLCHFVSCMGDVDAVECKNRDY
jgi:hypothetical protein